MVTKKSEILREEETTPEKRYLVMRAGYLKCKIARGRLDPIKSRLESLRDDRKPKESPQEYGAECIIKNLIFDKKKAYERKTVLATLNPDSLDDVVEAMTERMFKEMRFDPDKGGQTKIQVGGD